MRSTTTLDATILTGNLPAISGSSLTGVTPTKGAIEALGIAASSITGALPAIDGSALTGNIGKILQLVSVYGITTVTSTATTPFVLETLSVVPVGTNSTFLMEYFVQAQWNTTNNGFGTFMYKDGVEVSASGTKHTPYIASAGNVYLGGSWSGMDTSGSTAGTAISFTLLANPYSSGTMTYGKSGQSRGFVITEIAQ